jgi:integrase/recombinase XerD
MSSFPCVVRSVSGSGQVRYRLGDRLVDRYLEFVAGRCRPNTLRAVAFDLKAFFAVTGQDPVQVTAADVFEFLADQRGDRTVVRLADRESGLSARTIARRLSSVSGLYAYLVARGDMPVRVNPVPRGLMTHRQGGTMRSRMAPLVRVPRTLPRILSPEEADRLVAALNSSWSMSVPMAGPHRRGASAARAVVRRPDSKGRPVPRSAGLSAPRAGCARSGPWRLVPTGAAAACAGVPAPPGR